MEGGGLQLEDVSNIDMFCTKIVNNQREGDGFGFVAPQTIGEWELEITAGIETGF